MSVGSLKLLKFLKLETIAKLLNCKMMDRQQITLLVTLNRFCPFRKKSTPPGFNKHDQAGWSANTHFLHCVSSFEGSSYKKLYR